MLHRAILTSILVTTSSAGMAQEAANGIEFRFGVGPALKPGYFGDEDYDLGVSPKFTLERFRFGEFASDRSDRATGLRLIPSVRFIGARDEDEFSELEGLTDIDPTFEIGGGLAYRYSDYEVFATVRYGAFGHEAFVAELGSDIFFQPSDQLTLKAGPRVLLGDDDYAQTYFGISAAEEAASSFDAFDAGGGLMSAGAKAEATYAINDNWEVVGTLQYEQLLDDAADSPITQSDDQLSGSIVLTRRITLGF